MELVKLTSKTSTSKTSTSKTSTSKTSTSKTSTSKTSTFCPKISRDTLNYTEKFRGMYTVGWNYSRKRPNSVGKRPTVGIIFCPSPNFFTTLSVFIRF